MTTSALERHPLPVAGFLAVVSLPIHAVVPLAWSQNIAAGILALIAGVYIGFAANDGRLAVIALETVVALVFASGAMVALVLSPWWIAIGYIAHGFWDWLHHSPAFGHAVPRWYIPLCAFYDVLAGVGLLVLWGLHGS
ncbi:MAG: hypothetical protein AAGK79_03215 [Pseudomonadota bacterium]